MSFRCGSWRRNAGLALVVLMMAQGSLVAAARLTPARTGGTAVAAIQQEGLPESQESDDAEVDPDAEPEHPALIDPGELPVISAGMTNDEEQAVRLIERILAEQQMILSGQNFGRPPRPLSQPPAAPSARAQRANAAASRVSGLHAR